MSADPEYAGWAHEDLVSEVRALRDMLKVSRRDSRELRKYFTALTKMVGLAIRAIDAEMDLPSTPERGRKIARITNALELQNDMALRFGLGKTKSRRKTFHA